MVLPTCSPIIQHHEQTTTGPQQLAPPLPSPQRPTIAVHIPKGKVVKLCNKHPNIEVTLDGKELWDEFYRRGTEMIVNRAGRLVVHVALFKKILLLETKMTRSLSLPKSARVCVCARVQKSKNCCKQNTYMYQRADTRWWISECTGYMLLCLVLHRRMFPGFCASIIGLKPKAKYTMKLEVVLADNHRFKFLNARFVLLSPVLCSKGVRF